MLLYTIKQIEPEEFLELLRDEGYPYGEVIKLRWIAYKHPGVHQFLVLYSLSTDDTTRYHTNICDVYLGGEGVINCGFSTPPGNMSISVSDAEKIFDGYFTDKTGKQLSVNAENK